MTIARPQGGGPGPELRVDRDADLLAQTSLTKNQLLLWLEQTLHPDVPLYNMVMAYTLLGEVDVPSFQAAFQALVNSTDALRIVIRESDGVPHQEILPAMTGALEMLDLTGEPDPRAAYELWWKKRCTLRFDLRARLFDSVLVQLGPAEYVWYFVQHHLITDSYSNALVYRRLAHLYGMAVRGTLGTEAFQYPEFREYVESEARYRASREYLRAGEYWAQKLASPPPPVSYYGKVTGAGVALFRRETCAIGEERTRRIKELAGRGDLLAVSPELTQLTILGAVLFSYLARVSGNRRLAIGVPIRNRLSPSMNETVGLLMEVAPVLVDLDDDETFASLIVKMRVEMYQALQHYRYATGNAVRHKIYDVMLNYHPWTYPDFDGIPARVEWAISGWSTGGLNLQVHDFAGTGGLTIEFDVNEEVFDPPTAARMQEHVLALLDACLDNPDQPLDRPPILSREERKVLLDEWNRPGTIPSQGRFVHEVIGRQAGVTPDAEAVRFGGRSLSYRELDQRANRLGHYLQRLGVGPETLVGVCVDRSIEMVVGVLGILKTGGAYLPLDPSYPVARLDYMVRDAGVGILLTQKHLSGVIPEFTGRSVFLDTEWSGISREASDPPKAQLTDGSLAYVIYTSGSTGVPKGVMVEHRGIMNLVESLRDTFALEPASRFIQFASISFDAWVPEVFGALGTGATLCLPARDELLPGGPLEEYLQREKISVGVFPPSVLTMLSADNLPALRTVVSAGEACSKEIVAKWKHNRRFVNAYGPTETTVMVSGGVVSDDSMPPPIGRPIRNVQVYIVDRYLNPQPFGVPGELCVAGIGIARGYLGKPELTAERFPPNPFANPTSHRIYRTGDLVRVLADGNMEYVGRIDQQVKLRGFRIELGEIEAALSDHPLVRQCAVALREDPPAEKMLVGYVVPEMNGVPTPVQLRDTLKERLPEYMVPSAFVILERFPLTPSGKIDKKALPAPDAAAQAGERDYDPPRTSLEHAVAAAFAEVLRLPKVGRNDNFFEIGGQSLIAMQVVTRLRTSLNRDIRVMHLFDHPVVSSLAGLLATLGPAGDTAPPSAGAGASVDVSALSDEEVDRLLSEMMKQQGKDK